MQASNVVGGVEITLELGKRYYATRPLAQRHQTQYPVNIYSAEGDQQVARIKGFGFDEATNFVNEFNNDKSSFDGRVW